MWDKGGPTDCITCPVGFKVKPLYGDGSGRCTPCDEGWVDSDTGLIKEPGCGGGQVLRLYEASRKPLLSLYEGSMGQLLRVV